MLLEKSIEVSGPRGRTLVVYNGAARETYSCTPRDNPEAFTKLLSDITALNAQATAAGSLAAGNLQLQSQDVASHPK